MAEPPDDPVPFSFFNEIGIIEQLGRAWFEHVLPHGLNAPQFTVLNHLARLGDGKSPAEMARAFQVTKGAVTNTLQRLEKKGMIRIDPDPDDGRGKRVSLTARGRLARSDSIAALGPLLGRLTAHIPEERLRVALPLLRDIRQYLDANRPGNTPGRATSSAARSGKGV